MKCIGNKLKQACEGDMKWNVYLEWFKLYQCFFFSQFNLHVTILICECNLQCMKLINWTYLKTNFQQWENLQNKNNMCAWWTCRVNVLNIYKKKWACRIIGKRKWKHEAYASGLPKIKCLFKFIWLKVQDLQSKYLSLQNWEILWV